MRLRLLNCGLQPFHCGLQGFQRCISVSNLLPQTQGFAQGRSKHPRFGPRFARFVCVHVMRLRLLNCGLQVFHCGLQGFQRCIPLSSLLLIRSSGPPLSLRQLPFCSLDELLVH